MRGYGHHLRPDLAPLPQSRALPGTPQEVTWQSPESEHNSCSWEVLQTWGVSHPGRGSQVWPSVESLEECEILSLPWMHFSQTKSAVLGTEPCNQQSVGVRTPPWLLPPEGNQV